MIVRRRLRGFGEEITVTDAGNIFVTGVEGRTAAEMQALSRKGIDLVAPADASVTQNVRAGAPAPGTTAALRTTFAPPEQVDASDPRHPQHDEWLADQAVIAKRQRARARTPYIVAGGGAALAIVLGLLVIRKRRAA